MDDIILEQHIRQYIEAQDGDASRTKATPSPAIAVCKHFERVAVDKPLTNLFRYTPSAKDGA